MQAGVPIIPVTIIGSRQVLPKHSIIFRPGRIDMYIDPPIPTGPGGDINALMKEVRSAMVRHMVEADRRSPLESG
jgi:1-acyl-sn-glycerol-3-phosphate acyltransferase